MPTTGSSIKVEFLITAIKDKTLIMGWQLLDLPKTLTGLLKIPGVRVGECKATLSSKQGIHAVS